jgi:error-prone DNA polymerase
VIVWPKVYDRFRRAVIGARLMRVTGRLQREGGIIHLIAEDVQDLSAELALLADPGPVAIDPTGGRGDEARRPVVGRELPAHHPLRAQLAAPASARHPREQAKKLFPSRDFH